MDSCSVNGSLASNNIDDDASCELRVDDEIEELFDDGGQCWVPNSPIKPYVGQIFTSIDAAFTYYIKRRRTVSRKCDCSAKLALKFVGSESYKVSSFIDKHNHPFATDSEKQFLRGNRTMSAMNCNFVFDVASSSTGPFRAHGILKELCGSYSAIGATAVDFKNWMRDIKVFIGKHDSDMILQKFQDKRETSDNSFFYEYQTNSDGHLTRLFWADIEGRKSYDVFGDVISFDATYRTNK
ncbi:hypothetical protein POM88_021384 [Heracleum sosnowskyi]|uniref:Protein FAR1-RELATED SEQUENCE n=1 Tax=Heracleum sosnowskyi TaxID=360622 RepID=A0AAD8ID98_9APIA|nr:hypothetical protein POM88_021384 [Heracleum sosnowskyi]